MEVICLEDEAFYALVDMVIARIKQKCADLSPEYLVIINEFVVEN